MADNALGINKIEFMRQLDSDTQKLISNFGASSVSELAEKPNHRWLQ